MTNPKATLVALDSNHMTKANKNTYPIMRIFETTVWGILRFNLDATSCPSNIKVVERLKDWMRRRNLYLSSMAYGVPL